MMKTDIRPNYKAAIETPYMNTTGKCLRFFFRFLGDADDAIEVFALDEELRLSFTKVINRGSVSGDYWLPAYMALPPDVNRIAITGVRGTGASGMAIDDVEVTRCSNFASKIPSPSWLV